MINHSSTLFQRNGRDGVLNDARARVMVMLCGSRISIEDIALSLNCSESLVRALLASQYKAVFPGIDSIPGGFGPITMLPPSDCSATVGALKKDMSVAPGKLVQALAAEVYEWLKSLEANDCDRQKAIEQAVRHLDDSRFDPTGNYAFQAEWVIYDVLGAWRQPFLKVGEREFGVVVGRWLAAWVRFWVSSPDVWHRSLALAYARFEEREQAA